MAQILRYFYILLYIGICSAILLLGNNIREHIETGILQSIAQDNNKTTANGFTQAVWLPFEQRKLYCARKKNCNKTTLINYLKKKTHDYFEQMPIMHWKLYSKSGKLIAEKYDNDKLAPTIPNDDESAKGISYAQSGKVHSLLMRNFIYEGEEHIVNRSFFPIIRGVEGTDTKRVPAILEVTYDISPFWRVIPLIQWLISCTLILLFGVIITTLYHSTARNERLMATQYENQAELITAKTTAEEETREKSQFIANVSHELRTPLNAIIGFSEVIKDEVMGPLENQQYKEYINDIHMSGVHLLSLINDILDYSKADAGKLNVDIGEVDITKIMRQSIRIVSPRAKEAGIELIAKIPKEHYILNTDGKRLKQVLLNLLSNAVKFTPEGGTVTLYAWQNTSNGTYLIEVQDTGVGIAEKDISKVMQSFGQVENKLSRKHEGTGLGLPLSKKLMQLMKGDLEIASQEGIGTTVILTLPFPKNAQVI